jgi:hypothetical protein
VGAISLGWRPDGTRIRRKVTGRTKTDVREKLKRLRAEADAGLKTSASYTLAKAVDDWAAEVGDAAGPAVAGQAPPVSIREPRPSRTRCRPKV